MSQVISSIQFGPDIPWSDGLVKRRYTVTVEDNNAVQTSTVLGPFKQLPADNGNQYAADYLQFLKDSEIDFTDKSPLWNDTQADYDRRALGRAMLISNTDDFRAVIDLFQSMELRSGNNAGQRAATLGVSSANYTLLQSRFNDMVGASFAIGTALEQIWLELPAEFE